MIVKCPNCSAVVDVNGDGTDALAGGYKLSCPVIREKLIKEWALLRELECPHMRDASDAEIKKLKHGCCCRMTAADPVIQRRAKLIVRLQQQIALVQDPQFTLTRQKWIADETGVKQLRELRKKVRAWWRIDPTGAVVLTVRYGAKPIEFAPGKAAIAVGKKDRLVQTIETVIAAVEAGELDELISAQIKKSSTQFVKGKRAA